MNNDRRLEIAKAADLVGQASGLIAEASAAVEQARDDEQEYLGAMPEGFKQSERGQIAEAAIAALDDAMAELEQIGTAEIVASLEEATELSLQVETVPKRLTSKQAAERKWERLPQWAKEHMARLEAKITDLESKAASPFPDATGDEEEFVVGDYSGPLTDKALPCKRFKVPAYGLTIEVMKGAGVLLHADRRLAIHPRSGNEATVRSEDWR